MYGISSPLPNIGLLINLFLATAITSSLEENISVPELSVPFKKKASISSRIGVKVITSILKRITTDNILRLY